MTEINSAQAMKNVKDELDNKPLMSTVRQIAVKTKIHPVNFCACKFCGKYADDKLKIIGYDVCEVALECENCNTLYGIHHEKGVIDFSEVFCDVYISEEVQQ